MNVEVTSVSRSTESIGDAAAAVTAVSGEEIDRSGATSIPQALRFVPGINVAQQNSNAWAVSSRGFSSINSEKLLVLSDTRSIYTPLYSGVFWDVQDYLLDDIERIEVIRGPNAAAYGSNAFLGAINIITAHASRDPGAFVKLAAGEHDIRDGVLRYGWAGDSGHARATVSYQRDNGFDGLPDSMRVPLVTFRGDYRFGTRDTLEV